MTTPDPTLRPDRLPEDEAAAAVAQAAGDAPDAPTEGLIRAALRLLAPKE